MARGVGGRRRIMAALVRSLLAAAAAGASLLALSSALVSTNAETVSVRACTLYMVTNENGLLLREEKIQTSAVTDYVPFKTIVCGFEDTEKRTISVTYPHRGHYVRDNKVSHLAIVDVTAGEPSATGGSLSFKDTVGFTSQYHITTHLNVGEWFDQMPVGNGRIGAFVGGNLHQAVVPLSISNFFSYDLHRLSGDDHRGYEDYAPGDHHKAKVYDGIRKSLIQRGNFAEAVGSMMSLEGSRTMGTFQGTADLVMYFSSEPFQPRTTGGEHSRINYKIAGRGTLLSSLMNAVQPLHNPEEVLLCKGGLDLRSGLAQEQFVVRVDKALKHVHREWFASEHHDVIVGKISCAVHGKVSQGCLNMAMKLARGHDNNRANDYSLLRAPFALSSEMLSGSLYSSASPPTAVKYEVVIRRNGAVAVPATVTCLVAVCSSKNHLTASSDVFICNDASTIDVVSATVSAPSLGHHLRSYSSDEETVKKLKDSCSQRLDSALVKGLHTLRRRHVKQFSQRMAGLDFQLETPSCSGGGRDCNGTDDSVRVPRALQLGRYLMTSAATNSVSNLQGLWSDGKQSAWNGDFHMNINLQMQYWPVYSAGVGDAYGPLLQLVKRLSMQGRKSAREVFGSSDQVSFDGSAFSFESRPGSVPVTGAGASEHSNVIDRFDLAFPTDGSKVENPAWVSHGYTDSRLKPGPLGELQWSLCVSCAAWLCETLHEQLLYSSPSELERQGAWKDILLLYRGLGLFYKHHIYVDHDPSDSFILYTHTGPTTSPENSFEFATSRTAARVMSYITMTPAIDVSVLREMVNRYAVALDWLPAGKKKDFELDFALVRELRTLVYHFPNHALPTAHSSTLHVLEYPAPLPNSFYTAAKTAPAGGDFHRQMYTASTKAINERVTESDQGHRHFSAYHHLYPAVFGLTPSPQSYKHVLRCLYNADPIKTCSDFANVYDQSIGSVVVDGATVDVDMLRTYISSLIGLRMKVAKHGGHTGWSASWQSALHARLFDRHTSYAALTRVLDHYVANNYLALHPSLNGLGGGVYRTCKTCFAGLSKHYDEEAHTPQNTYRDDDHTRANTQLPFSDKRRSFDFSDGAVFQMDGNLGLVAATLEMVVHHHVPNTLHVLPALPTHWVNGRMLGVKLRGDRLLDLIWRASSVEIVAIAHLSHHPFLSSLVPATMNDLSTQRNGGVYKIKDFEASRVLKGFYRGTGSNQQLHIYSPNVLIAVTATNSCTFKPVASSQVVDGVHELIVELAYAELQYPCQLVMIDASLCPTGPTSAECRDTVDAKLVPRRYSRKAPTTRSD